MASITWREERDEWEVRWSEWSVETDPTTGAQTKRRVQRRRGCRTKAIAQQIARKVEDALALGQHPGEPPPISMRSIVVG